MDLTVSRCHWKLVPPSAIQESPVSLLVSADSISTPGAPLFEEKRHFLLNSLPPDAIDPLWEHWARFRSTFPADDDPVNSPQIDLPDILKKRLDRKESNGCIHMPKVVYAWQPVFTILN
jgi:hypothetical protein